MKNRKFVYGSSIIAVILLLMTTYGIFWYSHKQTQASLTTYLTYSQNDLAPLQHLSTSTQITSESLSMTDQVTYQLIRDNQLGDAYAARLLAYLYTAQRDFAALSWQLTGKFSGNPNIISSQILCLFSPNDCINDKLTALPYNSDAFSEALAKVVFDRYKQRYLEDEAQTHLYPVKKGPEYWAGIQPYYAQEVGSWMPWELSNVKTVAAPPSPPASDKTFWQDQLLLTETARKEITDEQTKKVVFWAGGPGTLTPPGIWMQIANDYMAEQNIPLPKTLLVRSVLAMGLADACIAVFDSKYTYWNKRPNMLDPALITVMPTPNHPSYPAGHSTISGSAATILNYYFPQNQQTWNALEQEAAYSRVWGGIHFTIDTQAGLKQGAQVGEAAIHGNKKP